ncbi:MAG: FADH(2)-oxidizing methylenetetrahydrofolate--tRNA-(uracil(54)-C(5))-methyltransferase TrmFO [Selenomonadaceae bacterium]|nr:FADH(2)-oxidizing methylenetetrahydrofolate--tRNA-(uracil(54)-C(5))-methyltransferase TrmFO [Selenomonadaceae bacterium]
MKKVIVIGAGLAGSEAAWQAAARGVEVELYEMRPFKGTPAHKTDEFAELVCSNSLRGADMTNAVGVLKEEMRRLDSLIMAAADATKIPAGGALAVDRRGFSRFVTEKVTAHPRIKVFYEEVTKIPLPADAVTIVATGPLTEGAVAEDILKLTGEKSCYFYDAAAPIVTAESIDMTRAYAASRYGKGGDDYLNCPLTEAEYEAFWQELTHADVVPRKEFEPEKFFEGCMPVEEMAKRGRDTLLFGPLKPVGLEHPVTGERPYAVVQLRRDNGAGTLYNIVGFQTHLKWPEQRRVFGLIPGLERAEFVRYGVMHRNTFLNSPKLLQPTLQYKTQENLLFAGQMTGVEGYVESAAAGLMAGLNGARLARGEKPLVFPPETCHGALARYITTPTENFQPMNVNFGLLPSLNEKTRDKKQKKESLAKRALDTLANFARQNEI